MMDLKIKIIYFWFFMLMFSNLFDRMIGNKIPTILFYFMFVLLLVLSIKRLKIDNLLIVFSFFPICFYLAWIMHPGAPFKANILSTKDILLPVLSLWIPISLIKGKDELCNFLNVLNKIFLLYLLYSIFQEIVWYSQGLSGLKKYLPWDYVLITKVKMGIPSQGGLLRFFGTMYSHQVHQIFLVVILLVLTKYRKMLNSILLFRVNFLLGVLILMWAIERTSIIMFILMLFIWNVPHILKLKYTLKNAVVIILFMGSCFLFYNNILKKSEITGVQIQRLINVFTFNINNDVAFRERKEVQWKQSILLFNKAFFCGLGPGRVTPSAQFSGFSNWLNPHNNYYIYYLGYGIVGLISFFLLLLSIIYYALRCSSDTKWFVLALVLAYMLYSWFGIPFVARRGVLFFFMIGLIMSTEKSISIIGLSKKT